MVIYKLTHAIHEIVRCIEEKNGAKLLLHNETNYYAESICKKQTAE